MSWEPSQSSSRASNRWRPPSPAPTAPAIPVSTMKRESWRPTSSWAPATRPDRQAPVAQLPSETSQPLPPRGPAQDRQTVPDNPPPTPPRARDRERNRERPYDDDSGYESRGYGGNRDRKGGRASGGGGGAATAERSWEAWNNKVGAASAKRQDDDRDRRPGPSRRDDYSSFDRKREMEDQAAGRSWSAWKSKVGVDDRDRRQPDSGNRPREREREEGWRPRRRNDEETGYRSNTGGAADRRGDPPRTWAAYRDKQDARRDDRPDTHGSGSADRRRAEVDRRSSLSPSPRKRSPSSPRGRHDSPPPRRRDGRRPSPDYGASRSRVSVSPPPRHGGRDRGSPDYGRGADGRERQRGARSPPLRLRSPSSPAHRDRSPFSPSRPRATSRARRRDDSPSTSSSFSSRDASDDDRPPPSRTAWRRDRSPVGRDSPEDRYKRQRRQSPDYKPLARPPSSAEAPSGPSKPPLPPQDALFHNGRAGPSPARAEVHPMHQAADERARPWSRDRPYHESRDMDPGRQYRGPAHDENSRFPRRPSPDYGAGGPATTTGRPSQGPPYPTHSAFDAGRSDGRLQPATLLADSASPSTSSLNAPLPPRQAVIVPPTGPHADRQPNGNTAQSGFPVQSNLRQEMTDPLPPLNGSKSPVKIDFGASPSKANAPTGARPAGLRQFFETDSPGQADPSPQQPTPPTMSNSVRDSEAEMDVDTPASDRPLHRPQVYLDQIAESEKQYSQHLDTIAPYIRSAFKEWLDQDQTQSLPAFLIHYFGRQPDQRELHQIEQLISLRRQTSRDQAALRDLHALASKSTDPSIPRGQRRSPSQTPDSRDRRNGRHNPSSIPHAAGSHEVTSMRTPQEPTGSSDKRGETDEAYERLACVGEGTYGKVYKARRVDDGVFVALKRIRMEVEKDGFPVTAMREIKLLQGLKHENIIRLHEMMVSKGSVYMVFDYMEHDLTGLLSHPTITFSPANLKSLTHQMLAGLGYLHRVGILHRDMKGSNILLTAQGDLKLADFGLARLYNRKRRADYTNRVITLWYRSPELLLGETAYGPEVDMWSAGCIMLEMFCTKPILQGNDEIHQLEVIYGMMGTPREEDWPEVRDLPWYELVKPKVEIRAKFREAFSKRLSPAALQLAEGLLAMNPAKRLSAKEALETAYFVSEEPSMEKPTQLAGIGEHHEMSAKQERHRRKAEGR